MWAKAWSLLKTGKRSHAKYVDTLKITTWQVALLWFVVQMQESAWCHWVGITNTQGRSGGCALCKTLILHVRNQKIMSSNYLDTAHTFGPLGQPLLTLVQGTLCLPFFVPSWRACLAPLTSWAGEAKCLSQYHNLISAIEPWQGCKDHGSNADLVSRHMIWTGHDNTLWCALRSLAWHAPSVVHPTNC